MELIFATQNKNKVEEIQGLLPNFIRVKSLKDIHCFDDIPETQPDLKGNALQKARYVYKKFGVDCFADDTGLEIESLNGEPGVYSARYAGPEKDSEKNIDLVLERLSHFQNRNAQFRTIIAVIIDGKEYVFEGKVTGKMRKHRSGSTGFGYDPIFEPDGDFRTYAEMTVEEKNKTSHRSRAIKKLHQFLTDREVTQ